MWPWARANEHRVQRSTHEHHGSAQCNQQGEHNAIDRREHHAIKQEALTWRNAINIGVQLFLAMARGFAWPSSSFSTTRMWLFMAA